MIYRSFPDDGLIEEPNYTKKEKFTKVSELLMIQLELFRLALALVFYYQ